MKRSLLLVTIMLSAGLNAAFSQPLADTTVYLVTCGPGTDTYSIYGHSALRVTISAKKTDTIFNWGVFDFNTKNFAWKFAKGRLDYVLDTEVFRGFLSEYFYDKRWVQSQKINLNIYETRKLLNLINENLKPENIRYRYDFFYDDCSTRIRDLIEKTVGKNLLYPPSETGQLPTFREMVGKYQDPFPWLRFGVDLIMGSSGDKKAPFRDRMFLPIDMKNELSEAVVNRSGKMIPLLQNPETILDFAPPAVKQNLLLTPAIDFTIILVLIIIFTSTVTDRRAIRIADLVLYAVFSILAVLMIFFNFFTDHQQMRWNLNIIWLNPFIIFCFIAVLTGREWRIWFRLVFGLSVLFLVTQFILPQAFDVAFFPLVLILVVRSSVKSGFDWNPLTLR